MDRSGERCVDPVIEAYKKDVDRTMLRESLRRTPEDALREEIERGRG